MENILEQLLTPMNIFFGIFTGLLEFDTAKLDESIPKLLDGMKIAFATSLVGWKKLYTNISPEPEELITLAEYKKLKKDFLSLKEECDI